MEPIRQEQAFRIGELAHRAGMSTDAVRYYERLGLVTPSGRTAAGYRLYGDVDLRRLRFIRRAKLLGLALTDIRDLVMAAEAGECYPLRQQVATVLRRKIEECDAKLAELMAFKASLAERYQVALDQQDEPACQCAAFPARCACLPVQLEELPSLSRGTGA